MRNKDITKRKKRGENYKFLFQVFATLSTFSFWGLNSYISWAQIGDACTEMG